MQLVRPGVAMFDPLKNKAIGEAEVREKFGVGPDRVVDVQSLAGDSTDNVPGVPGIGVKTAAELIGAYGDLDALLARAGEIKQPKRREALLTNADLARISRDLVRLKDDCELPETIDALAKRRPDPEILRGFLEAQAFRSLLARFQADGSVAPAAADGAREAVPATRPAGASGSVPAPVAGPGSRDRTMGTGWRLLVRSRLPYEVGCRDPVGLAVPPRDVRAARRARAPLGPLRRLPARSHVSQSWGAGWRRVVRSRIPSCQHVLRPSREGDRCRASPRLGRPPHVGSATSHL
jgi:hypothetical protein